MSKAKQQVELADKPLAVVTPIRNDSPMQMLQEAVINKMDPAVIKDLMDLLDRWEASEARKAFTIALTGFKSESIEILKTKRVKFNNTSYVHAELSDITDAVAAPMARHALSYRWDVRQDAGSITVDCILMHAAGHSERVTMTAPPDDSGSKNKIQQIASTVTYLERYTLLAVTGLSTKGTDDGGKAAGAGLPRVTQEQVANLQALIDEVGKDAGERATIKSQFLKYRKVESLEEIAEQAYSDCVKALEHKRTNNG